MKKFSDVDKHTVILGAAGVFCAVFFVFSANGLISYLAMQGTLVAKQQELQAVASEICKLEKTIVAWKADDFYVEKMAREQLAMARPDEVVYLKQQKV